MRPEMAVLKGETLFESALAGELRTRAPLAERMRPRSLDELVGQEHLLAKGAPFRSLVERDRLTPAILWGPPGSGKTTIASVVARHTAKSFVAMSAVSASVRDVRDVLDAARQRMGMEGRGTILFLDEVHRFNRTQQDVLLPAVEQGLVVLIGATTENPFFELNAALLSRTSLWRLVPLDRQAMQRVVERACDLENVIMEPGARERLLGLGDGDVRAVLTVLEVAIASSESEAIAGGRDHVLARSERRLELREDHIEKARSAAYARHGADEHYDMASAFIKAIRGSDVDAGLYWLARLLQSGEDPRFIARRLCILASEDVGLADPQALLLAAAGAQVADRVGLPEAALNLAEIVVYLARAPKSNSVTVALERASADARAYPTAAVPSHLRDSHYRGARLLGHGVGYLYPHDDPSGFLAQEYRPAEVAGRLYYDPNPRDQEPGGTTPAPEPLA